MSAGSLRQIAYLCGMERELKARFPAISACRLEIESLPSGEAQAHVEIRLPQHQIIFNEIGPDGDAARATALATAAERLAGLAKRDPGIFEQGFEAPGTRLAGRRP